MDYVHRPLFFLIMISNIYIENNRKAVTFSVNASEQDTLKYIYVDLFSNRKNITSTNPEEHSYKIYAKDMHVESNAWEHIYRLSSKMLCQDYFESLYIITFVYNNDKTEQKVIFNENELYFLRLNYLTKHCNNCIDKNSSKIIMNLLFRETLLKNAIALNRIDDSVNYYEDVIKAYGCYSKSDKIYNNVTSKCSSGTCKV